MNIIELGTNTGTLQEVAFTISSATTTAVIAARIGYITRVYKIFMTVGAAQTVDVKDDTTSLSGGAMGFASSGVLVLPLDQMPWFTTTSSKALNLTTSTSAVTVGRLYYTQPLAV